MAWTHPAILSLGYDHLDASYGAMLDPHGLEGRTACDISVQEVTKASSIRAKAPPLHYIDNPQEFEAWVKELEKADVIAVDTESDSFHHYREKVCLIQMTALGKDVIIDPLALEDISALGPLFKDPTKIKILHDAGYDLVCLRRDYDFEFQGIFDTMLATRLLGEQNFGLGAILQHRFGFTANKRLQRSDWARRPLTEEQLDYARYDTHFLPRLMELLKSELKDIDRLGWAEEEFARLPDNAARNGREPSFDPDGFWRIRGVKTLSPAARGRARALYIVRDSIAQRLDRPPFKVFGDSVIIDLSKNPPRGKQLQPRSGLRRAGVDRFGDEMINAIRDSKPINGKPPPGSGRRRRPGRFLDPEARRRYEELRKLRKKEAKKVGLDPEVAMGNATLEEIAKEPPKTLESLVKDSQLEGWREPFFAQPILTLLEDLADKPLPKKAKRRSKPKAPNPED